MAQELRVLLDRRERGVVEVGRVQRNWNRLRSLERWSSVGGQEGVRRRLLEIELAKRLAQSCLSERPVGSLLLLLTHHGEETVDFVLGEVVVATHHVDMEASYRFQLFMSSLSTSLLSPIYIFVYRYVDTCSCLKQFPSGFVTSRIRD